MADLLATPPARAQIADEDLEQLDRLVRTTPWAWLLSTVGAIVCYLQYLDRPGAGLLTVWLVTFCAVSVGRLVAALVVMSASPPPQRSHTWMRGWLVSTWIHALQWGLLPLVIWTPGSAEAEAVLHMTLAAIAMGGAVRLPGFFRTLVGHVVCVLAPLVLRDLLVGNTSQWLMALMAFLIGAYAIISGRNQARSLQEILAQRARNAQLIEALRQENARSEAARQAAEAASEARSRFFAAANHDLRQPLHAMGLLAQTLHARSAAVDVGEVAQHLSACVDGMAAVVDDLLDITRLDVGHLQPQWSIFDLRVMLEECCRPYRAMAQDKGLSFELLAEPLSVRSDRTLLTRVVSNLLSNAIRYTHAGAVRLRARADGTWVDLRVEDTGIGIAAEHLPRIFEEFYQVGNPARDRRLGLGLGLATVQRLGALLGLAVSVDSAPGRGSVFVLKLPVAPAASPADKAVDPSWVARPLVSERRILVVEDDADSRAALVGLLKSWGCDATGVPGLAQARGLLSAGYEPDALIADLRLADGASGIDAVKAVRMALARDIPAIIVTGDAGSEQGKAASAAGLTVALKPLSARQLRAFLYQALATS
jgi:two-component system, sensor histidine kinase